MALGGDLAPPQPAPLQRGVQLRCGWPAVAKAGVLLTSQTYQDSHFPPLITFAQRIAEETGSCTLSEATFGAGVQGSLIASAHLFAAEAGACLDL